MTLATLAPQSSQHADTPVDAPQKHQRWRPSLVTWLISILLLAGSGVLLYPATAQWITSYNQSRIIEDIGGQIDLANPDAKEQLRQARAYNEALTAGVEVLANTHVPAGDGTLSNSELDYRRILAANADGLMARIKIPAIAVDLPVYHGTSDNTLLRGAGHLEGSSLPIGGKSTHSVITAHRGLAGATMFTNLDKVEIGDRITIEVFGKVLTYEVRETKVVAPDDTDSLRAEHDSDLVTLITCTPLGVNTHRILVTAERVTPTPEKDVEAAGERPDIPGFPWWGVGIAAALLLAGGYVWWAGYGDARTRARVVDGPSTSRTRSTPANPKPEAGVRHSPTARPPGVA